MIIRTLILTIVLCGPAAAQAATLSFEREAGAGQQVSVRLTSKEELNTVGVAIAVPAGVTSVAFIEEDSLISYWLEKPRYDAARGEIYFSGVVPGGWKGEGILLALVLIGAEGELRFVAERTEAYVHGPEPVRAPLTLNALPVERADTVQLGYILLGIALALIAGAFVLHRYARIEWIDEERPPAA